MFVPSPLTPATVACRRCRPLVLSGLVGNLPPPLHLPPQQNLPPRPAALAHEEPVSPLLHEAGVAVHGVPGTATDGAQGRVRRDGIARDEVGHPRRCGCGRGREEKCGAWAKVETRADGGCESGDGSRAGENVSRAVERGTSNSYRVAGFGKAEVRSARVMERAAVFIVAFMLLLWRQFHPQEKRNTATRSRKRSAVLVGVE